MVPQSHGGGRDIVSVHIDAARCAKLMFRFPYRYTSVLVSVQKTEDLLRRHRKGKKSTFSLFGASSNASTATIEEEEERFKQQMLVDIRALGNAADSLGVKLNEVEQEGVPGWNALLEIAERNCERLACYHYQVGAI